MSAVVPAQPVPSQTPPLGQTPPLTHQPSQSPPQGQSSPDQGQTAVWVTALFR